MLGLNWITTISSKFSSGLVSDQGWEKNLSPAQEAVCRCLRSWINRYCDPRKLWKEIMCLWGPTKASDLETFPGQICSAFSSLNVLDAYNIFNLALIYWKKKIWKQTVMSSNEAREGKITVCSHPYITSLFSHVKPFLKFFFNVTKLDIICGLCDLLLFNQWNHRRIASIDFFFFFLKRGVLVRKEWPQTSLSVRITFFSDAQNQNPKTLVQRPPPAEKELFWKSPPQDLERS